MGLKLAVFVSGGGSNLQSMIDKAEAGHWTRHSVGLVQQADVFGVERAKRHGIETWWSRTRSSALGGV